MNEQYIDYTINLCKCYLINTVVHYSFILIHSALTNLNKHDLWF